MAVAMVLAGAVLCSAQSLRFITTGQFFKQRHVLDDAAILLALALQLNLETQR